MKCARCGGTGSIVTHHRATHLDPPEDFSEDCPSGCVECDKCGNFTDRHLKVGHGTIWCFDCVENYEGPGDDYYSDFYGGGQATQDERYREAAAEKRKLG